MPYVFAALQLIPPFLFTTLSGDLSNHYKHVYILMTADLTKAEIHIFLPQVLPILQPKKHQSIIYKLNCNRNQPNNCSFKSKEQSENVSAARLMEMVVAVMKYVTDLSEQTSQRWHSFIVQFSQRVNPLLSCSLVLHSTTNSLQHPKLSAALSYALPLISVCMK